VALLIAVTIGVGGLFKQLPPGFLPNEDQGAFFTSVRLPDGASTERADAASAKIETTISKIPGVERYFTLGGLDIATGTSNSNVATVITTLKPWDDRTTPIRSSTPYSEALRKGSPGFPRRSLCLRPPANSGTQPDRRIPIHAGRPGRLGHR